MDVQVFDTWIKGSKGDIHIDILMPTDKKVGDAIEAGKKFLKRIGEDKATFATEECSFCHIQACTPEQAKAIEDDGYAIIKMSGC